ncbi:MAG TPA: Bax inhibitor-1 family protein, partial [Phycisphaerae bacterium]|nr:Bax inhibitor-1 family protein [Phycisphaerae bacterium]
MNQEFSQTSPVVPVIALDAGARGQFIGRTYAHLLGAILLFTGLEFVYFQTGAAERIFAMVAGTSWLLVLGAFMLVSWLASRTAHMTRSFGAQYLALAAYVTMWSLIFVPLLMVAEIYAEGAIQSAALTTIVGFAGLTCIAFGTRKDFSFL